MNQAVRKRTGSRKILPDADTSVLARLAALKRMSVRELKLEWESLFDTPAPNNSRGNLELRLSWRIQELALGGLSRQTAKMLELLADELDGKRNKHALIKIIGE